MRIVTLSLVWALLLLSAEPASAVVVVQDSFNSDYSNLVAADDNWTGSYCNDGWATNVNGGVMAMTDDGCEQCGCNFAVYNANGNNCVQSDPFDNHIQTGDPLWQNYQISVHMKNVDDDAMGVIFRYQRTDHFYLFLVSRDQMPTQQGCSSTFAGARLIRITPEGGYTVLHESVDFPHQLGVEHDIRILANGHHIKVEFDRNGDGQFGPEDVFFDGNDNSANAILEGRVGLYAFENGVYQDWEPPACASGECWFDDFVVDLLPPESDNCGNVGVEGMCINGVLHLCNASGQLEVHPCGDNFCCGWYNPDDMFTCIPMNACGDNCADGCTAGQTGCSSNLTHQWACGQGDSDSCVEPVYTLCTGGSVCNPATGQCSGGVCTPNCAGKQCGDDGCGGLCGVCAAGFACENGVCVDDNPCTPNCTEKECGPDGCGGVCGSCGDLENCQGGQCKAASGQPCTAPSDCASSICLPFDDESLCTTICGANFGCEPGWQCVAWLNPLTPNICVPTDLPTDLTTCEEVVTCVDQCNAPEQEMPCLASCYFTATPQAQESYALVRNCVATQCEPCQGAGCIQECLFGTCFQAFAACYPGETSCADTLDCMQGCPQDTPECTTDCYTSALPGAKVQLAALFACTEANCPSSAPACVAAAVQGPCADPYGACLGGCQPLCGDAQCGPDGCGGACGICDAQLTCVAGTCVEACQPQCAGRECGADGCGGICGTCPAGVQCVQGACNSTECTPDVLEKCDDGDLYWFDSCGQPGEMVEDCQNNGCEDGACVTPSVNPDGDKMDVVTPVEDIESDGSGTNPGANQDPVEFSASGSSKGSGCSMNHESPSALPMFWLFCAGIALLGLIRRRRYAK